MSAEFHEGDLVEAVKGEAVNRGRLQHSGDRLFLYVGPIGGSPKYYERNGWTITVIEKAAPKLPTTPGWYESEAFPLGTEAGYEPYALTTSGEWYTSDWKPLTPEDVRRQGKLHRLERESVTAKKVLAALRHRVGSIDSAYDFEAVAAEFGVTE